MFYSAAWTNFGWFSSCEHSHETIGDANSCPSIQCAGSYVVGVEDGVMRSLTDEEEAEFQLVRYGHRIDKPPLDILATPAEAVVSRSRYTIMTRIRLVIVWT